jgi:hypothetical protein
MKVYVVVEHVDYEGHCAPAGVFSSLDAAKALADQMKKGDGFEKVDDVFVYERELVRYGEEAADTWWGRVFET